MKFPKEIYAKLEQDSNDSEGDYLIANQDLAEVGADGDVIGIYRLIKTKKKKITEELV